MHQYHLGRDEEKDGELVVSKVFYQQTQRSTTTMMEQNDDEKVEVTSDSVSHRIFRHIHEVLNIDKNKN